MPFTPHPNPPGAAAEPVQYGGFGQRVRDALSKVVEHLKAAPAKLGHKAVEAVKKQVREAKDAFGGVRAILSGGKATDEQKSAMKKVAIKVCLLYTSRCV